MWNQVENFAFKNVAATQGPFTLRGGNYGITASGTISSVALQRLSPDGSTYVSVMTALTAAGYANVNAPSGTYQIAITGSGVYVDVVATVTSQ